MTKTHKVATSFHYQSFMQAKDWLMLAVLSVVSSCFWAWMLVENQKPFVDPAWIANNIAVINTAHAQGASNHAPKL